ncbi:DsbC family protein [Psychrobacter sp. F1192]|uniref:Thiol:disulfide interchange protein n=1 Tax=Psychrobacter coccoides TaxID=2818440 RepID=A0ABS3NRP6_9GAMM|nr:DsbC family protein [Psychrobacter coccoides]MBO1531901.1 DsbC family protein [Psychrobacter coccoides]
MSFLSSPMNTSHTSLRRHRLSHSIMAAVVVFGMAGCSNANDSTDNDANNTDASVTTSTQANSNPAATVSADSDAAVVKSLQDNLQASGIEETITSAVPTDMEGIYWVSAEGLPSFFTDQAGKHIIQGQIISVGDGVPVDISSPLVARTAQEALKNVDESELITYPATGETKAVVYSFTDADCPYCTKLHEEMSDINAHGIEVRYLAWPRNQQSIPKMEAIWCSEDRMAAMDQAKMGANVQAPACESPVAKHMALGASLGVRGTPAIFTESGEQVGGYLPAAQLAQAVGIN